LAEASKPHIESPGARAALQSAAAGATPDELSDTFDWDSVAHVIRVANKYIHLSPIEGRIFDLLLKHQGRTVTLQEFMQHALKNPNVGEKRGLEQLRPHMMRLRRKLAVHPPLAGRIVNTRGSGYMMI
ncbi:MAG: winged helix-turn-helix domain-containing protein, partial [Candidatus Roseilinea sp.]|uniref:winged helix-turn-helix domain-containing protein n=1 Tax=Candidatus Roseilinea sp. TaxID=2838777 RepID=UPI0040497A86